MVYRVLLPCLLGFCLIIAGCLAAYLVGGLVFDRSYMMTQHALGAPGAELWTWLYFALSISVVVTGIIVLITSYKKLS
jgi:hypothetical protein